MISVRKTAIKLRQILFYFFFYYFIFFFLKKILFLSRIQMFLNENDRRFEGQSIEARVFLHSSKYITHNAVCVVGFRMIPVREFLSNKSKAKFVILKVVKDTICIWVYAQHSIGSRLELLANSSRESSYMVSIVCVIHILYAPSCIRLSSAR